MPKSIPRVVAVPEVVLQLQLSMRREAIGDRKVDSPCIVTPRNFSSASIRHVAEELLIPARGGKKLWRKFVFRLKKIAEDICVSDQWNFEARFVEFRPELHMMPFKGDVLANQNLVVITEAAAPRQRRLRFIHKVSSAACEESKIPHLVRPESQASAHRRPFEVHPRCIPAFGAGRERRILEFDRVVELSDLSRGGETGGVTRPPDDRIVFILVVVQFGIEIRREGGAARSSMAVIFS